LPRFFLEGGGLRNRLPPTQITVITRHNELYHNSNTPEISDVEYDRLKVELLELERLNPGLATDDSPSQQVGAAPRGFTKRAHLAPMLSLDNLFTDEDVHGFVDRLVAEGETVIVIEPKIDGLSLSLIYCDGVLVHAVTRGDGTQGDDVTRNATQIAGIPFVLEHPHRAAPTVIEVRGEVCITLPDFEFINKEREEAGETLFANPRNAAVGGLKSQDLEQVRKRRLSFFAYDIITHRVRADDKETALDLYTALKEWGFTLALVIFRNISEPLTTHLGLQRPGEIVTRELRDCQQQRSEGKWTIPTDGAVLKAFSLPLRSRLGNSTTAPRWAAAFKFPPAQATTKLLAIDIQVGRTGALTPVARLEPVQLDGTTVSNASFGLLFAKKKRCWCGARAR
jgi:DNA ligase (NAD+)